ncbi:MAG: hypothetical protein K9L70_12400 [Thiohalocapsa sp.]|nr:hypothetical protein [Thiohalocapsa sp.]MCF7992239.1 hypothetical protein [Thiohalocapsa sp.]
MSNLLRLIHAAGRNEPYMKPITAEIRIGRYIPPEQLEGLTPEEVKARQDAAIFKTIYVTKTA